MTVRSGSVYLIGAGPGDPGLITVRGLEILGRADVVLHDRLIAPELLRRARPEAALIDVGKSPANHRASQEEINDLLISNAMEGRAVARLKGGDPFVFGRGAEELDACERAGVPCEVVPGITSAIAGPASAGIAVTARSVARGFAVVSGRSEQRALDQLEDLRPYAHADTLLLLMSVARLESIARTLMELGRSASTPIAIVERAGMAGERTTIGELQTIAAVARERDVRSPAVIVIGDVVRASRSADQRLAGRRIVVTRPRGASSELADGLRRLGADVALAPLIEIEPVNPKIGWEHSLSDINWIVATSRHGARGFARALRRADLDARAFAGARIAAVGPTTAREFAAAGLQVDLTPATHRALGLITEMQVATPAGGRALFARGSLARDELVDGLESVGIEVTPMTVYKTNLVDPDDSVRRMFDTGVDATLLASPSAAQSLARAGLIDRTGLAICIGPTTASAARDCGASNIVVAKDHSDHGLLEAALASLSYEQEIAS